MWKINYINDICYNFILLLEDINQNCINYWVVRSRYLPTYNVSYLPCIFRQEVIMKVGAQQIVNKLWVQTIFP